MRNIKYGPSLDELQLDACAVLPISQSVMMMQSCEPQSTNRKWRGGGT